MLEKVVFRKKTHTTSSTKQAQKLCTHIFVEFHITLSLIYHQRVIVIQVRNILVTVWIKTSAKLMNECKGRGRFRGSAHIGTVICQTISLRKHFTAEASEQSEKWVRHSDKYKWKNM